jgi:hypothetical protein
LIASQSFQGSRRASCSLQLLEIRNPQSTAAPLPDLPKSPLSPHRCAKLEGGIMRFYAFSREKCIPSKAAQSVCDQTALSEF